MIDQTVVVDEFYMPLSSELSKEQLDTLFSNMKGNFYLFIYIFQNANLITPLLLLSLSLLKKKILYQ